MDDTTPKPPESMGTATRLANIMRQTPRHETDPVLLNRWIAEHRARIARDECTLRAAGYDELDGDCYQADAILGSTQRPSP